ncbi:MAG: hypothetical protein WDM84_04645 [Bauldia sp.]
MFVFTPPAYMLPPPLQVFEALRDNPDLWRVHAVTTLSETLVGLVVGQRSAPRWRWS